MASYSQTDGAQPSSRQAATGIAVVKKQKPLTKVPRRSRRSRSSSPQWLPAAYEAFLIALFIGLATLGMFHHELWRDETQSWLLARDSPSLLALFQNAHHEGHPLLWHYCLYGISRLSRSLLAMQIFNLLLAVGSVWLIVKKSPFSLLERSLLIFGYFTFYEYALISRSYGLGVFLAFLFCALYCTKRLIARWQAWLLTLTLVLLANTSILGLILSGVLAIALYYRLSITPEQTIRKSIGAHFFTLIIAWATAAFQIGRSLLNPMGIEGFDAEARTVSEGSETAQAIVQQTAESIRFADGFENADKLLQIVLKSHLPIPTFRFHFWNEHLLESQTLGEQALHTSSGLLLLALSASLVGLVFFVAFQLLRRTRLFLFIYGLGCLSMTAIFVVAYIGATRHYGHLFILLLVCLWLSKWSQQMNKPPARSLASKLFALILCVQAIAGIYAYTSDLLYPFSASYQTAQILDTQILNNQTEPLPILAINQRPVSPLSGYLDRDIFYPEADKFGSFWDISYPEITDEVAIIEAIQAFSSTYSDFVAVLTLPLQNPSQASTSALSIQYLTYIGPSIVEDEAFFLYRVSTQ